MLGNNSFEPTCGLEAFVINSEPKTGARPSIRLCVGSELARCVDNFVWLQGRRGPTPSFFAAGAGGVTTVQTCVSGAHLPRNYGLRAELAEGTSPPIILSDFRASDRRDPRRRGPRPDREWPGRRPRREAPLSLLLQQAEGFGRVLKDQGHAADAGSPEAPRGPARGWLPRPGCGKARSARYQAQKEPRSLCRGRLQQHIRVNPRVPSSPTRTLRGRQQTKKKLRSSSGSAPSTRKICGSSAGNCF